MCHSSWRPAHVHLDHPYGGVVDMRLQPPRPDENVINRRRLDGWVRSLLALSPPGPAVRLVAMTVPPGPGRGPMSPHARIVARGNGYDIGTITQSGRWRLPIQPGGIPS